MNGLMNDRPCVPYYSVQIGRPPSSVSGVSLHSDDSMREPPTFAEELPQRMRYTIIGYSWEQLNVFLIFFLAIFQLKVGYDMLSK